MTKEEFERLWIELDDGINGDFYLHLPLFGDDAATLDGGFTAKELRQIADAIDKLKEAWELVKDKDSEWPKK